MSDEELFHHALEKPGPERAAFLDEVCAGDLAQRQRVEALLRSHESPDSFLAGPAPGVDALEVDGSSPTEDVRARSMEPDDHTRSPGSEDPAGQIGRYRLLQPIGEGGMGTVYMAEQLQPVRRRVALKVIKPGMDSRQVIARFEAERQALALMDHVNIARVLDAGTTESGLPYFVMELVQGVPITRYCDDNQLTPRQRLELFVPVCQAVQHAHQKGIIHRDIKPSNVLVTLYDGRPVPKVIDFGVAKAIEQSLTERTLFTQYGTMIGTLEYMSPEQAEMSALGVDTRSDIYSLGVLLYELLTGSTPLDRERMRRAAFGEIVRLIKEEEPARPSIRLSESGAELAAISARRQTEPARLTKLVRGELDWIVMRSLEKDRNRRYETANGFAADVLRYLNDEAVLACPPSVGYRLRKFVHRNRGPVIAAVAVACLLVTAIVGTSIGLARALRAERAAALAAAGEASQRRGAELQLDRAVAAEALAQRRLAEVSAEKQRADEERARALESEADTQAFGSFVLRDVLSAARPKGERGGLGIDVTVKEAVDASAGTISERFRSRPRAEALIRHSLGVTYRMMGDLRSAAEQLRLAYELRSATLGAEHTDTILTANSLAVVYQNLGRLEEAEPLMVAALGVRRRLRGDEDPETLRLLINLGWLRQDQGRLAEAESQLNVARETCRRVLGDDHATTIDVTGGLAWVYFRQGRPADAEPLCVDALERARRVLGEEHAQTLVLLSRLSSIYQTNGRAAEALALAEQELAVIRRIKGDNHPDTLTSRNNLGSIYRRLQRYEEAEAMLTASLESSTRLLGEGHTISVSALEYLWAVYNARGEFGKAEPLLVKALDLRRKALGAENPTTLATLNNLAFFYQSQRRWPEADALTRELLRLGRITFGDADRRTVTALFNLALIDLAQDRIEEAESLLTEGVQLVRKAYPADSAEVRRLLAHAALVATSRGHADRAEPLFREALDKARTHTGTESTQTANCLMNLGHGLNQQRKFAEAEPLLRESLAILRAKPPDAWRISHAEGMLGLCLLGLGKPEEAEPLLLAGYGAMKAQEAETPSWERYRLTQITRKIFELYEAHGPPEKAAEWRQKVADLPNGGASG